MMIWYDHDDDRVYVEGALRTYAPRELICVRDGDMLMGRLKVRSSNEFGPVAFTEIVDHDGNGFGSVEAAKAYLDGVFAWKPAPATDRTVPIAITEPGQTVIPLQQPPTLLSTARLEVNGLIYRSPEIAASAIAITWQNPDFPLDPTDRVTAVYS